MAKETAKERKEREKAEQLAIAQAADRQTFEINEERARQQAELQERVERLEILYECFQRMVNPESKLMVRRTEFDEIRSIMQKDAAVNSQRVHEITDQYLHMKRSYSELQVELVHLRAECRSLYTSVKKEMERVAVNVSDELNSCIARIEDDILNHRQDVEQCGQHLHVALEAARRRSVALATQTLATAEKITSVLQEQQAMHTRIPRRIRNQLLTMEKDDLILMLDSLSFDESALQYMLYRFPPPSDDPFSEQRIG